MKGTITLAVAGIALVTASCGQVKPSAPPATVTVTVQVPASTTEPLPSTTAPVSTTTAAPIVSTSTQAPVTTDSTAPLSERDKGVIYLTVLKNQGISGGSDEDAIAMAHAICKRFDSGLSVYTLNDIVMRGGFSTYQASFIVGAASAAFCPQYNLH